MCFLKLLYLNNLDIFDQQKVLEFRKKTLDSETQIVQKNICI